MKTSAVRKSSGAIRTNDKERAQTGAALSRSKNARKTHLGLSAGSWLELEPKKHAGIERCKKCNAVRVNGFWHAFVKPSVLIWAKRSGLELKLVECDACQTAKKARGSVGAVGELRISAIPELLKKDILGAIHNAGMRAQKQNAEDRIIEIREEKKGLIVTTTENQLVVRIGKKLHQAFKGGDLAVQYSEGDAPIRVFWTPPMK